MGHKRTRNRYPRLPDAVQNLLALHSLVAVPRKGREWHNGAALCWMFDVFPEKVPLGKRREAIFQGRATDSLGQWVDSVDSYLKRGLSVCLDFDTLAGQEWTEDSTYKRYMKHCTFADAGDQNAWPVQGSYSPTGRRRR